MGCGDTGGGCRTFELSPNLLCRRATQIPGFVYLGQTTNELWGRFAPDVESTAPAEYREKRHLAVAKATMPAKERDFYYSKLIKGMGLQDSDRAALTARGFTEEMIERFGAFSYGPDQYLPLKVSKDLPGVLTSKKGQVLPAIAPGIYFPIRNHKGEIHGLSLRFTVGQGDEGTRRYATGSYSGNPSNLLDQAGEQPIAVCLPAGVPSGEIALVEGTGFKPFLLSQSLGAVVLGASGGNFGGSVIQITAALKAKAQPGQVITLYPDGGAIANPHVIRQYERACELIESLGYEFRLAWWGQFTKTDGDADEVSADVLASAARLTWAEWIALTPAQKATPKPVELSDRDRLIRARQFQFNQRVPFLKKAYWLTDSQGKKIVHFKGWKAGEPLIIDFTAAPTLGIRGGLGSGKTEALIKAIVQRIREVGPLAQYYCQSSLQIIILCPTNGLCRELEARLNRAIQAAGLTFPVWHFQDDVSEAKTAITAGAPGAYVACKESFGDHHMESILWDRDNVVVAIDEFSTFRQSAPNASAQVVPELMRLLRTAKTVLALDANLSDLDAAVIGAFRGDRSAIYHVQIETKSDKKIHWVESRTAQGEISMSHKGVDFTLIQNWKTGGYDFGGRVAVAADSKLEVNMVHKFAKENRIGSHPLSISSQTVDLAKDFMPGPGAYIEENGIDFLAYTPTIQSGVDIQVPFDKGIALCTGVTTPTGMMQMIGRLRNCKEWWVSAPRYSQDSAMSFKALSPETMQRWMEKSDRALERLGSVVSEDEKSDRKALSYWIALNSAQAQIENKFNSECCRMLLESQYATVDVVEVPQNISEWSEQCEAIKEAESRRTMVADYRAGIDILTAKRPPANDQEVWDVAIGEVWQKHPKFMKPLRNQYFKWQADRDELVGAGFDLEAARVEVAALLEQRSMIREMLEGLEEELDVAQRIHAQEDNEYSTVRLNSALSAVADARRYLEAVEQDGLDLSEKIRLVRDQEKPYLDAMRAILSDRIESIYRGELARQNDPRDRARVQQSFIEHFTSAASKRYKAHSNQEFFNTLNLGALATGTSKSAWKSDRLHSKAPEILDLYERFQASPELQDFFPEVDGHAGFWVVVKSVLRSLGYEIVSGQEWVSADGVVLPNGTKNGKQQYSKGRVSLYLSSVLAMEHSGNVVFRNLWPALLEAIRDRIDAERERFSKDAGDNAPGDSGGVGDSGERVAA